METLASCTLGGDSEERLLEALVATQQELEVRGVEYRVIGSIAVHAWMQGAEALSGRDSPGDIDLIVPRGAQLKAARVVRSEIGERFGVKLGLSLPSTEIDFRPDEPTSFLTHRGSRFEIPVASELFAPRDAMYGGVPVQTIDPRTLLHTYAMPLRRQDVWKVRGLYEASKLYSTHTESEYRKFHAFIAASRQSHSILEMGVRLGERVVHSLPAALQRPAYNGMMPLAAMLGLR